MTADKKPTPRSPAWLVGSSDDVAGTRYRLKEDCVRIGRDLDSDVIPEGPRCSLVSKKHAQIVSYEDNYELVDLDSRNGTFVNSEAIQKATLKDSDRIQFGSEGPEFEFRQKTREPLAETMVAESIPQPALEKSAAGVQDEEELLIAVSRARSARRGAGAGQTLMIMRGLLQTTKDSARRRLRLVIAILAIPLVAVTGYAIHTQRQLTLEKAEIDEEINTIEVALTEARDPEEFEALISELDEYQRRAREIQRSVLYQLGLRDEVTDFIEAEIQRLMTDLGAAQYSIPAEFRDRVTHYIGLYQGPNRAHMNQALAGKRDTLEQMRTVFAAHNLPSDLAFITVVESAFRWDSVSSNGAAGPWQFVPATARAFGLKVDAVIDERFDLDKSTGAAALYVRRLISEFGAGTSAMLALAAYNLGPTRVRRVVRGIEDPIKQRSFWYLYRNRTLPAETREYIPKIVSVIIMLRNPGFFGFEQPAFD